MNTVEDIVKNGMFHELLPEFEENFWKAHEQKNVQVLITLNETLNKIIDDLKAGNSFVLDNLKK